MTSPYESLWVSSDRVIAAAMLIDEGDEVEFANSSRDYAKPFIVQDIDVTEWGHYATAELRLNQGLAYWGSADHYVEAVEGQPAVWKRASERGRVHQFDPVEYDDADVASMDFARGIDRGTRRRRRAD